MIATTLVNQAETPFGLNSLRTTRFTGCGRVGSVRCMKIEMRWLMMFLM